MKEKLKIYLPVLIGLLALAISSSSEASIGGSESELNALSTNNLESLVIDLPEPLELEVDGVKQFAWDLEGYVTIIQMYGNHILLLEEHAILTRVLQVADLQISTHKQRIELINDKSGLLQEDRDHIYEVLDKSQKMWARNHHRQKIKIILISAGTGLTGIAAGFLIGFLVAR